MKGTLRIGDQLIFERETINKIKKGDVIIFKGANNRGEKKELVHRVISISEFGLITRGDNNFYKDKNPVSGDTLIGRVTHLDRNGHKIRVRGGMAGFRRAKFLQLRLPIKKMIWVVCKVPYKILRKSDLVPKIWQPEIKKIVLKTQDGVMVKFFLSSQTVALFWPEEGRFYCKKPYDLVIKKPGKEEEVEKF